MSQGQRTIDVEVRVRYSETDAMGFLHHSRYFVFFEMGRTELLRAQGGNYRDMEAKGQFLVVAEASCRYRRAAKYDDLLTVRTSLAKLSPWKMEHEYQVLRDDVLLTTATTTLACVDRDGRILRLSDVLPNYELLANR
jgi:acyl-CoA thioester hydrolase